MHLPHFIEKSQQFLEGHVRESLIIVRYLTIALSFVLFAIFAMIVYASLNS